MFKKAALKVDLAQYLYALGEHNLNIDIGDVVMNKSKKAEITVCVIAVLTFVITLVGHLAGASYANSDAFGMIAAPIPLVLAIIAVVAYKIAAAAED